jgi:hypothetical protein
VRRELRELTTRLADLRSRSAGPREHAIIGRIAGRLGEARTAIHRLLMQEARLSTGSRAWASTSGRASGSRCRDRSTIRASPFDHRSSGSGPGFDTGPKFSICSNPLPENAEKNR